MPYLKKQDRDKITLQLNACRPAHSGELNFAIQQLILNMLDPSTLSYDHLNAVIGALDAAKSEFYRRIVVPYETGKIRSNGDCFQEFIRKANLITL